MKTCIVVTLFLLLITCVTPARAADPWTTRDIALEATWLTVHLVDWAQTRWMADHDWRWDGKLYKEKNPLLGEHPSVGRVDAWMATGALLHIGIAHVLPKDWRTLWQGVWIIVSGACVVNNNANGAGVSFSF